MIKKAIKIIVLVLVAAIVALLLVGAPIIEKAMNPVGDPGPYSASERAVELHKKLLVADLHADSLLNGRDLLERSGRGHVDVPRLIEGNVAVQAFTVVTKATHNLDIKSNSDKGDAITLLAIISRWPISTWTSLKERALYQARRFRETADASEGKLTVIETGADLAEYIGRRTVEPGITAGFLGIEGAHALEGDAGNVDELFDAGFRMIGPVHFFDNKMAGSQHGEEKYGLTPEGRKMIARMYEKRMIVDLAHASVKTIDEILDLEKRPAVLVSHTGVKGTCDNNRNISDEQIKKIAEADGVIGIGYWKTATCGTDVKAIVRAIRHTVNVAGIDHVGLGSDYDGTIKPPFDTSGLVLITEALLEDGFTEPEIGKIMGGNTIRLLMDSLPVE